MCPLSPGNLQGLKPVAHSPARCLQCWPRHGAALAAAFVRWLSRFLPGLLHCRCRLPPELFTAGPAPGPAPARRLRYSHEIQSPDAAVGCWCSQPTLALACGVPGSPAWGHSHLAKQFNSTCPSGLTPSRLVGDGNQGLNMCPCPCPRRPPCPSPACHCPGPCSGSARRHGAVGRQHWLRPVSRLQGSIIKGPRSLR